MVPEIFGINSSLNKSSHFERDWIRFNQENFILNYFPTDCTDILKIEQGKVNCSLEIFFNRINYLLDCHAPLKNVNKYKLRLKSKPWIGSGLKNQYYKSIINVINKLLKKIITLGDSLKKVDAHINYKNYRNMLSTLLKKSKQNYKSHLESNKNNIKVTTSNVSRALYHESKTINNLVEVTNTFNKFFTIIDAKTKQNINYSHVNTFHIIHMEKLQIVLLMPYKQK